MSTQKLGKDQYEPVDASPVKSFFVSMLTRDIKLEEAILDLLDNCIDGILRKKGLSNGEVRPYEGFWANIKFEKDTFEISDNCGGIPWDLHDYAFRMGPRPDRPADVPGSVGVYGIGMKRAIFKMGKECLIWTQNGDHAYEVEMTPDWMRDEKDWRIPVKAASKTMDEDGTTIIIGKLYSAIAKRFKDDSLAFKNELERMVATHYAFIIEKGFTVKINGKDVRPRPTKLIFLEEQKGRPTIQPFIFKTVQNGVEVFLAVGFTRPIPSQDEVIEEQEEKRYSSMDAGWTVLCNDRAVLYCDRSELTGWGEAGVPRYHTQFIAISGIVEFRADDASKLPTTTTKRGIETSSLLYLQIKNKMREGMSIFTDYTNKWKGRAEESRKHIEAGQALSFREIKNKSKELRFNPTRRTVPQGEQYKPNLPMPLRMEPYKRRISFAKQVDEIRAVAEYLFKDPDEQPSKVGEKCFDLILREARR
jgi:hypothetical protein